MAHIINVKLPSAHVEQQATREGYVKGRPGNVTGTAEPSSKVPAQSGVVGGFGAIIGRHSFAGRTLDALRLLGEIPAILR